MKALVFVLIALALVCAFKEEEDVLVLTDNDFEEAIQQYEFLLVKFYAPWCGHCKKLAPEFSRAAKVLKQGDKPVPLAKVDTTVETKLGEKYKVQSYPTLKFFNKGVDMEYNGGRTEQDIINWIQKRTGSLSTELKNQSEFDAFTKTNKVVVVYFGTSESDEKYQAFKSLAMAVDSLSFAHVFDSSLTTAQKASNGSIVIFKQFDEGRNDYSGEYVLADLKSWADSKSFATVMEFDDRAIEKVFQQQTPTLFLFQSNSEESQKAREVFNAAASSLKGGKVIFSVSRPDDGHGHWQRLADYVGVNTAKVPALMLVHAKQEDVGKFKFEKEITKENIEKFVNDFTAGKIEKYLKSEEIPEKQEGNVKVLVGKNFQSEVIDNTKDVLVKFYAPWCGHCKSLAPKWEAAADKLKDNKNIVIAKCDSTANEVPGVSIKGFPTIKFFPGNNKSSPIDFEGERTEEGILKWLQEHSTHPWVEPKHDDL